MKIALVHDQLQEFGGAERVLVTLKKIYPDADVYTSFYNPKALGVHALEFKKWNITTSWASKIPFLNRLYSPLRFITPWIWELFDFSKYDLVISSSGSYMCKGIRTNKPTIHISYIHHPPRYLYGYETALEWQKYLLIKIYGHLINHPLRMWDYASSQRADFLIANSIETKKRIQKFYRRDSTVIYPPVSIPSTLTTVSRPVTTDYYLTVSRLARAKHVDILIKSANKMKFHLKIVGRGRDLKYLQSIAGPTVEFLTVIKDSQLSALYQNAKAFLFSSLDEEFGIAPVEAMGHGLPVIALRSGGVPETLKEGLNGYLFDEPNENQLIEKIRQYERLSDIKKLQMKKSARTTAEQFTEKIFIKNFRDFVQNKFK